MEDWCYVLFCMGSQSNQTAGNAGPKRILDALRSIVRELRLASSSCEKQFGLSAAQLFVLQALRQWNYLSLGELAERTATDQSSVSVVVRKLEEKALVAKRISGEDRRRLEISLTPAGKVIAEAAPQPVQERLIGRISSLTGSEKLQLAALLERLVLADQEPPPMFFEEPSRGPKTGRKRG